MILFFQNIELQVQGGGGVYHLGETLVFPPFQDFRECFNGYFG